MANPKEMQDTDGVENPRMVGDSADQMFDDDTMEADEENTAVGRQGRAGGTGGLNGGLNQIAGRE